MEIEDKGMSGKLNEAETTLLRKLSDELTSTRKALLTHLGLPTVA